MDKIALFDLDYTILRIDSTFLFIKEIIKKYPKTIFSLPKIGFYSTLHITKIIDRKRLKEIFYSTLKQLKPSEIDLFAEHIADKSMDYVKKGAFELIKSLKEQGFKIIIITASPEFYAKLIAKKLNVDMCIGTKLLYNKERVWIEGKNCKGIEKIKRLKIEIDINKVNLQESIAYQIATPMTNAYFCWKWIHR
jgi:HAD superfamily phosphoserine phosphatase-like hydrolase